MITAPTTATMMMKVVRSLSLSLEPLVGAAVPPETETLVVVETDWTSLALGAVTLLYVVVSDATTVATAVANEAVSVTPLLAVVVSTPDASDTTELYCTFIAARRASAA